MTTDIITTQRLVLRSACHSDLAVLHDSIFSDPEVMSQAFTGRPYSKQESANFFTNSFDHAGNGRRPGVLVLKGSGNAVGFAGLLQCSVLGGKDYEIGFVLARDYWGKGYATEIAAGQIEYGLGVIGCKRLLALVSPANRASVSVLLKVGMTHHSTIETEARGMRDVYLTQGDG